MSAVPSVTKRIQEALLDVVFPPTCVRCEAPNAWLCPSCRDSLRLNRRAVCPGCGASDRRDHVCDGAWSFASVVTMGSYADPTLRALLTSLKYQTARCLLPVIEERLRAFQSDFLEPWPWAGRSELTVVALPGDEKRMRERGIDHAALLADVVQSVLVPWGVRSALLQRVRQVLPNAQLPPDGMRTANVRGVFEMIGRCLTPVLLVDDVLTTGATAKEAADILLRAGIPEVHVFTFAQGHQSDPDPRPKKSASFQKSPDDTKARTRSG